MKTERKHFGWSPDGGKFVRTGGKIYWHDGAVTDAQFIMREGAGELFKHSEDYSQWTDAHRAKIRAKFQKRYKRAREKEHARLIARNKLVASAEAKLTSDEIFALSEAYRY